jgi:hypothetical protein
MATATDTDLTYEADLERWEREAAFDNPHWSAAKACIAKGNKAEAKANDFYITAGQHLKALKAAHDERGHTWDAWEALLKERVGIGKTWASELMQIADGTKTIEQFRDGAAKRMGKTRALRRVTSSPQRCGENSGKTSIDSNITTSVDSKAAPTLTIAKPCTPRRQRVFVDREDIGPASSVETERKLARLEELETENVRLRRENLALRSENDELKARLAQAPDDIPPWLRRTLP